MHTEVTWTLTVKVRHDHDSQLVRRQMAKLLRELTRKVRTSERLAEGCGNTVTLRHGTATWKLPSDPIKVAQLEEPI